MEDGDQDPERDGPAQSMEQRFGMAGVEHELVLAGWPGRKLAQLRLQTLEGLREGRILVPAELGEPVAHQGFHLEPLGAELPGEVPQRMALGPGLLADAALRALERLAERGLLLADLPQRLEPLVELVLPAVGVEPLPQLGLPVPGLLEDFPRSFELDTELLLRGVPRPRGRAVR